MIGEGGDRVRNWQNVADEANKERERLATGLKEERLENDKLRQKLEFNSRESNAVGCWRFISENCYLPEKAY